MQKYLQLLLELLWSEDDEDVMIMKKNFLAVWEKLEGRGNRDLKIFHRAWFVFFAYDKLLSEKITLDEFLAIWDVTSGNKLLDSIWEYDSLSFLNKIIAWDFDNNFDYQNTLFILDLLSFISLSDMEQKKIQDWAKSQNSELLFC